jgi:ribosomal protein S18 acetylase RimI-like enzyme
VARLKPREPVDGGEPVGGETARPGREPGGARPDREPLNLRFRRPTEADYPRVVDAVDAWWEARAARGVLPRLWFRHFTASSWIAEEPGADRSTGDGAGARLAGFLVGFRSADHPDTWVIQAVAVDPGRRRRGVGRSLVDHFLADVRRAGGAEVEALVWPGDPPAIRFLAGLGFSAEAGPGTMRLYGTDAFAGYDFGTEDRARFRREV